jgi:hypothetical protein
MLYFEPVIFAPALALSRLTADLPPDKSKEMSHVEKTGYAVFGKKPAPFAAA